jgi:hypothetical protein
MQKQVVDEMPDPVGAISKVSSIVTVVVASVTAIQGCQIKNQQDQLAIEQQKVQLAQEKFKQSQDEILAEFNLQKQKQEQILAQFNYQKGLYDAVVNNSDINKLPLILNAIQGVSPASALTAAMSYPNGEYEAALTLVAGADSLREAKDMGTLAQARVLLDKLDQQIEMQKQQSQARFDAYAGIPDQALKFINRPGAARSAFSALADRAARGGVRGTLTALGLATTSREMNMLRNDLIRDVLKKAPKTPPLFTKNQLRELVSQGSTLLSQAKSPAYEEIVDSLFIDRVTRTLTDLDEVSKALDKAMDEDLNDLAYRLNEIYENVAPAIDRTKTQSDAVIGSFTVLIGNARTLLDTLDRGAKLPEDKLTELRNNYDKAIQAATVRNAKRIDTYVSKANFVVNVIRAVNRLN